MKVVIGPLNIASQPHYLVQGLRQRGIDAICLQYGKTTFGYRGDWERPLAPNREARATMFATSIRECLEAGFDIFHFFNKSLFFSHPSVNFDKMAGFDIPLIKARGHRVAYRFTGWELIDRKLELERNPYSAFQHGWDGHYSQDLKAEYLAFLREYADAFMVVDPMMQEHCPEAEIVPRVLPVDQFYKGSKFVLAALEELRAEGVEFELKLLERVPFTEAVEWYKRADIIVDQLLIGWYGVLAMECMAMGKPVAVYMRPDLADTPGEIPVWNVNLDNLKDRLRLLIQDFDLRLDLASRSRDYVRRVHDFDAVIPKLIGVYEQIMAAPPKRPHGYADIDFLLQQRLRWERVDARCRRLVVRSRKSRRGAAVVRRQGSFAGVARKWAKKIGKRWRKVAARLGWSEPQRDGRARLPEAPPELPFPGRQHEGVIDAIAGKAAHDREPDLSAEPGRKEDHAA
jgi:hypothetical protein